MRDVSLPQEFLALSGKVSYIQKATSDEYSSSCPQCGGTPHKNGEWPDRFRMFLNAHGKNKILGWCRHCSYVWFPQNAKPISKEEFEFWRKEQLQREEERKRSAERAIALLQSQKIWVQYHAHMNEWTKKLVAEWGISEKWQEYWQLGLIEDYTVYTKTDEPYHSPAITIPVWHLGGTVSNVKLRVLNPKSQKDRYRSLYKTGEGMPFVAWNRTKFDSCLLVEGEKKAMVTAIHMKRDMQVIGIPTKTPSQNSLKVLDGFGKVYVCLDPDANGAELKRLVDMLGRERVAVAKLPGKIDDLIVDHKLDVGAVVKYAKKMEVT